VEDALELAEYLPLSYKTPSEEQYVAFLWDAFTSNYENEKYQFAFLAYHMLTMCAVYFNVWQIRMTRPRDFERGLIGFSKDNEEHLLKATSPFTFSKINESSILRILRLIDCDNAKIGTYAKLVRDRNDTAHANGNIFVSTQKALDGKIAEVLRVIEEIQTHSAPIIQECYSNFLTDSADPEEREYVDEADEVREVLIHGHYFSERDVRLCQSADLSWVEGDANAESIRGLHQALLDMHPLEIG